MTQNKKKGVLSRLIKKAEKQLARLLKEEKNLQSRWSKGYARFKAAIGEFATLKNVATKKAENLRTIISGWDGDELALNTKKDAVTKARVGKEAELADLKKQVEAMVDEIAGLNREIDMIVSRVFELNGAVVAASEERQKYLSSHVYERLVMSGKKSQFAFDSSDGLRRVVVLMNHITLVQPDLAGQAQAKIQDFFAQFSTQAGITDPRVKALYDITQAILVSSEKFKVGPDLYKFLSIEIDEGVFPELYVAQKLLRSSLRSATTTSYVRLYKRASKDKQWEPEPQ